MKPVKFFGYNITLAKDQPEYLQLSIHVDNGENNFTVTSCWKLSWKERIVLLIYGRIWNQVITFGAPLQPQKLTVYKPDFGDLK